MHRYFFIFLVAFTSVFKGQTFYEKIMEMNIANADTSNDRAVLDMSAKAIERVSRGTGANWDAAFHMALCFVRMTDISLNLKDTVGAKIALSMSATQLKKVDTMSPQNVETKILNFYHKINELRIGKQDLKKIKALEAELESFHKLRSENPRAYLISAYLLKSFYAANKTKRKKELQQLQRCEKLFFFEKTNGYAPHWGKKWLIELSTELTARSK